MAGITTYRSNDNGEKLFSRSNKKSNELSIDFAFELETSGIEVNAYTKMPHCIFVCVFGNKNDFWRMERWLGKHADVYSRCDDISAFIIYDLPLYIADSIRDHFDGIPFEGDTKIYIDCALLQKGECDDFPSYEEVENYFMNATV